MSRPHAASRALSAARKNLSSLARPTTPASAPFLRTRLDHPPLRRPPPHLSAPEPASSFASGSGSRKYASAALAVEPRRERVREVEAEQVEESEEGLVRSRDSPESDDALRRYLNGVFKPLKFPTPLAKQIMTHVSYKFASDGHNARLAFLGRRTLQAYFHLFLAHMPPHKTAPYDFSELTASALNTYLFGEHVAQNWDLARHLRWNSSLFHGPHAFADAEQPRAMFVSANGSRNDKEWLERLDGVSGRYKHAVGLHKVLGTTVEAVVGGVYHQFGGTVAHRLFITHLLPYILLHNQKEGVHNALIYYADDLIARMGGKRAPLLVGDAKGGKTARGVDSQQQQRWARAVM